MCIPNSAAQNCFMLRLFTPYGSFAWCCVMALRRTALRRVAEHRSLCGAVPTLDSVAVFVRLNVHSHRVRLLRGVASWCLGTPRRTASERCFVSGFIHIVCVVCVVLRDVAFWHVAPCYSGHTSLARCLPCILVPSQCTLAIRVHCDVTRVHCRQRATQV